MAKLTNRAAYLPLAALVLGLPLRLSAFGAAGAAVACAAVLEQVST